MRKIFLLFFANFVLINGQLFPVSAIPSDLTSNANTVVRKNSKTITINKINDIEYDNYSAITVINKDGDKDAAPVIFYEKGDRVNDVKVTIYDAEGKKIKTFSKSNFTDQLYNAQGAFHSDSRVMFLEYSSATYPYTIELSYRYVTDNTVFIPNFVPTHVYNQSVENTTYVINNKSGIDLRNKVYSTPYDLATLKNESTGESLRYSFSHVKAIEHQVLSPSLNRLLPKVSFSLNKFNLEGKQGSLASWDEFGKWYYNDLIQPVSITSPTIKTEVDALNLTGTTEEKVKKLYQYMQNKTRYVFVALGIGGWQPVKPDEVHAKGYGDCKGLTNYMKALLDAAGIPSYYSVIESYPSPTLFDPEFPKMSGNHVILMVPTEKGNIWLENTSQQIAFNYIGRSNANRNVITVNEKGAKLVDTPTFKASDSQELQKTQVKILPDGTLVGKSNFTYSGSQYETFYSLAVLPDRERTNAVKDYFESLNFDDFILTNFKNDKDLAKVYFDVDFKSKNYAKNIGDGYIFRAVPIVERDIYKNDPSRMLPFEISQAYRDDYEVVYEIPIGYVMDELPPNIELVSEFGKYKISYEIQGEKLLVKRSLEMHKGLYKKELYNDYINFRKKIQSQDFQKILISKTK